MTDDLTTTLIVANLVSAVVGLAYYAWYGFALSRLFPKIGAEGWKGWVPILNEVEILVRGGLPGWNVVFYFIPIVQLYGIYLKAMAVHRINESFGRGAGYTVLGIFLPPLWATLLVTGRMPAAGDYDRRVEGLMAAAPTSAASAPQADALGANPIPAPPAPPVYASAPPPPPPAPVPQSFPSFAAASEPPPPPPEAPPAPPTPVAPPAPPAAAPALEPGLGTVYNPWAQDQPAAPAYIAPVAPPAPPPAAAVPPPPPAAAPVAPPVAAHIAPPPSAAAPVESTAPALAPIVLAPDDDDDDDEFDRTVAVDRRPVVPWRLVTDEGHVIPLRTRKVLLGRKPVAASDDVDVIAVPDSTKTLSKNHARLELSDEGTWTVFDLDSTNGVIIIESDGTETLLPQGGSAPIPGRFMLGKVAMRVSFDGTEATR